MSGLSSAEASAKSAQKMQSRQFSQDARITSMNNRASIIGATSPMGAKATQSALQQYISGSSDPYDTTVQQGREVLPSNIERNESDARYGNQYKLGATLVKQGVKSGESWGTRLGNKIHSVNSNARSAVSDYLQNRGSKPRRFQFS
ncbi:MAG: putative minor capsid protein [Microviridae sp.]|nr:MAG: putative minor capsid protein [Microviridae sp.]